MCKVESFASASERVVVVNVVAGVVGVASACTRTPRALRAAHTTYTIRNTYTHTHVTNDKFDY